MRAILFDESIPLSLLMKVEVKCHCQYFIVNDTNFSTEIRRKIFMNLRETTTYTQL